MEKISKRMKWLIGIMAIMIISLSVVVGYLVSSKSKATIPTIGNESLENVDNATTDISLLLDYSGGIDVNTQSKEAVVYVDYYEKGVLKKQESVMEFSQEDDALQGRLVWGLSKDASTLTVALSSDNGLAISNTTEVFWLKEAEDWMAGSSASDGKREIKTGGKYLLYKWVSNENQSMSGYIEDSEEFKKERIAENDKLVQLYVEFK